MGTVIKAYTAIFLVLMCVFLSIGILAATVDVQNARDYHAACVNEIENSNHAASVIETCISEAADNGYTLEVVSYPNYVGNFSYTVSKVILKYQFSIPILNITLEQEILGYAR